MSIVLSAIGVTKSYRRGIPAFAERHDALRGVTLEIRAGELVGLLGPNGAGKSTFLLCAAGLLRPDGGSMRWFGGAEQQRPAQGIGWVPERPAYYAFLTVREALEYYATLHDIDAADRGAHIDIALERVALQPHRSKRISQLSRGMTQRLGLAQALIGKPKLLLLDETLSGLDPVTRRDVREVLRDVAREGTGIVLSTHDLDALERLADRVVVLQDGAVRAELDPRTLTWRRVLVVEVSDPRGAAVRLGPTIPGILADDNALRVPLDGVSPEEVLAACQAIGISVIASRVVADDLEGRFFALVERRARVAEGG